MARKTVLVSDLSGKEISEGKGATMRITFHDARKGVRELDVTDDEAEELGGKGRAVARRGRRPKSATSVTRAGSGPSFVFRALSRFRAQEPSGPGSTMGRWR